MQYLRIETDLKVAKSLVRIDLYTRSARTFYNLNRWIGLRVDTLGALFTTALAAYFVYRPRSGNEEGYAAKTGFSLNMAGMLLEICSSNYTETMR